MVVGMYYRFGLGIFMMLVEGQQVYGGDSALLSVYRVLKVQMKVLGLML